MKQTPENNFYLWWLDRSTQERIEYRKGLSSVEATKLLKKIQADCRKYLDELEGSQKSQPNGHARKKNDKLEQMWDQLSEAERRALQEEMSPKLKETG